MAEFENIGPHLTFTKEMKNHHMLLTALLLAFIVHLPAQSTNFPQPAEPPQNFETSAFVQANAFVPAAMMSGSLHSVGEQAWNNGLQNTYQLTSGGTTTSILGTPLLIQRIREIYAIEYLRGVSKTDEFTTALAKAAGEKVNSVINIARNPIGTVQNLPKGASRFFGNIGEGLKGAREGNAGNAIEAASGMSKAKAKLAFKLGVSPYTDNVLLQEQLSNAAWAMASGGLVLSAASVVVPGAAGTALTAIGGNQILQNQLIDTPPTQLRIINRKKLLALDLDQEQADAFLMQPYYSPENSTIIVHALSLFGVDPQPFLNIANAAASREDAFYFQRLAQLLLQYHRTIAPIRSLHVKGGLICALDKNGVLVVPASLDYAIWNEPVSNRVNEFSALLLLSNTKVKSLSLWTDGQLSTRLCDELTKRNISYRMLALDSVASK